jgi:hypothetical protein
MLTAWNSAATMETLPSPGDTAAERDLDAELGERDHRGSHPDDEEQPAAVVALWWCGAPREREDEAGEREAGEREAGDRKDQFARDQSNDWSALVGPALVPATTNGLRSARQER